ncbi:hypothetical protein [Nonomuraea sp. CA-141351]|uniref:hypothetical protein n=1 Tax=Nonomuraea sp. CA-141351 TaxID=3239996 RepID=UPI003D9254DF
MRDNQRAIDLLLREAFRDSNVADDFNALTNGLVFGLENSSGLTPEDFIRELVARAYEIPVHSVPRQYWNRKRGEVSTPSHPDMAKARAAFASLISDFEENGYLAQKFPKDCVDDYDRVPSNPALEIEERLGAPISWPLEPDSWDDDTFFGLVEVFHDLVSRPRESWYHSFANCGTHYSCFATESGRRLYRWHINRILEEANLQHRLAEIGEHVGRIEMI